jgi:hypothetical protein
MIFQISNTHWNLYVFFQFWNCSKQEIMSMKSEITNSSARRHFLQITVGSALGSIALAGCSTLGLQKTSKASADYQEPAKGKKHCGDCVHFQKPHGCTIVAGAISAGGVCNYFLGEA